MLRGLALLLVLFCVACTTRETARPIVASSWPIIREVPTLRLPPGVTPVSQQLELRIDPYADWYTGRTEIEVDIAAATSIIWLNGHDLRVGSVTVTPAGGVPMRADYTEEDGSGFASIRTLEPVPAGKARMELRFGAPLQAGTRLGLYKLEVDGQPYVFTQLQPIAARTVFPCFDEPGFKIPYDVSLVVPHDMRVVANTRELSRSRSQRLDRAVFATTEKLPSYLIAFAVGDFDVVDAGSIPANAIRSTPIPLRGFTTKGHGDAAMFALSQVGPLLAKLEEYTTIGYAYDKLDIIGVPDKNGAMENPGAITMRESLMLDVDESDFVRKHYTEMMAHELAHLWVGDLVTLAWWDDVWLNEAFATWLAAKAAHAWAPELGLDSWRRFHAEMRLDDDSLPGARAIREPIRTHDDIEAAFDRVVYDKGAAVIAMLEHWLGEETWRRGFSAYLTSHRHGTATTADLVAALRDASGKDPGPAIGSFLNNRGAPVVTAALRCATDSGAAQVELIQTRYLPVGSEPDQAVWGIPVCVHYGGKTAGEACTMLGGRSGTLTLPESAGCPAWVLPNSDGIGYYRPALAPQDRKVLAKLSFRSLSSAEREVYAHSVSTDYERGAISYGDALETLIAISLEEPSEGDRAVKLLSEARLRFAGEPLQQRVERFVRTRYGPALGKVGLEPGGPEHRNRRPLRYFLIKCLAMVGRDPALWREAKRRGLRYLIGGVDPQAEKLGPFVEVAFRAVGEDADLEVLDALVERGAAERPPWGVREALAAVRVPAAVTRLHESLFGESEESQLKLGAVIERFSDPELAASNWDWLVANPDTALRPLMEASAALWPLDVVGVLCDPARIAQAEKLLPPLTGWLDEGPKILDHALARARMCVAARNVHEPEMRAYFESK